MATLSENAQIIAAGYNNYRDVVERVSGVDIIVPKGTRYIGDYAYYSYKGVKSVIISEGAIDIGNYSFFETGRNSTADEGARYYLPNSLQTIGNYAFAQILNLYQFQIPENVKTLGDGCFVSDRWLTTINIPASLNLIGNGVFGDCLRLTYVTVENGFNCNNLNLSYSTLYSVETIVSWFNALYDRTGDTAYTLTIGSTNLAKLSAEQIAIATNKNWNLA